MKNHASLALVAVLAIGLSLSAADGPYSLDQKFNPKIDSWAEGTLMTVDADGGKFAIRGYKRPYSTAYARMLKDIHDKTANLDSAAREQKAEEIRNSYQETLAAARKEAVGNDGDFTFYLPAKDATLFVLDETRRYDTPVPSDGSKDVQTSEAEREAMRALKDLKIGERVVVGYDAGALYHNAYTVIKIKGSTKASTNSTEGGTEVAAKPATPSAPGSDVYNTPAGKTGIHPTNADMETSRKIRRDLVEDKSLSVAARNIQIVTEHGQVTLTGTVLSQIEKEKIEKTASTHAGTGKVTTRLEIKKD